MYNRVENEKKANIYTVFHCYVLTYNRNCRHLVNIEEKPTTVSFYKLVHKMVHTDTRTVFLFH